MKRSVGIGEAAAARGEFIAYTASPAVTARGKKSLGHPGCKAEVKPAPIRQGVSTEPTGPGVSGWKRMGEG